MNNWKLRRVRDGVGRRLEVMKRRAESEALPANRQRYLDEAKRLEAWLDEVLGELRKGMVDPSPAI